MKFWKILSEVKEMFRIWIPSLMTLDIIRYAENAQIFIFYLISFPRLQILHTWPSHLAPPRSLELNTCGCLAQPLCNPRFTPVSPPHLGKQHQYPKPGAARTPLSFTLCKLSAEPGHIFTCKPYWDSDPPRSPSPLNLHPIIVSCLD